MCRPRTSRGGHRASRAMQDTHHSGSHGTSRTTHQAHAFGFCTICSCHPSCFDIIHHLTCYRQLRAPRTFQISDSDDVEWRELKAAGIEDFEEHENLLLHKGRLYVPSSLRAEILRSRHDALSTGHPGCTRTLTLVERNYSWPGLRTFVHCYVSACDTYICIKAPRHKPYGLLQPLDIPNWPWCSISGLHHQTTYIAQV